MTKNNKIYEYTHSPSSCIRIRTYENEKAKEAKYSQWLIPKYQIYSFPTILHSHPSIGMNKAKTVSPDIDFKL